MSYSLRHLSVVPEILLDQFFDLKHVGLGQKYIHHSYCCLPYDRSIPSSKASSPQNVIYCFLFQFPV